MSFDEAAVGQGGADRKLTGDERRGDDLGELACRAVARAAQEGEAFALRRAALVPPPTVATTRFGSLAATYRSPSSTCSKSKNPMLALTICATSWPQAM